MDGNRHRRRPVCLPLQTAKLSRQSTRGKVRDQYIALPAGSFPNSHQHPRLVEHDQSIAFTKEASTEPPSDDTDVISDWLSSISPIDFQPIDGHTERKAMKGIKKRVAVSDMAASASQEIDSSP